MAGAERFCSSLDIGGIRPGRRSSANGKGLSNSQARLGFRPSGEWKDDDYVLANGIVVGRIFKVATGTSAGASTTLGSGVREKPKTGSAVT
jgi:hypothetical protein